MVISKSHYDCRLLQNQVSSINKNRCHMDGRHLLQSSELKDQIFYEDLSLFIKIFRKIINKVENVTYHLQQEEDCSYELESIKSIMENHDEIINRYCYELDQQPSLLKQHCNIFSTYYRFVYRINEIAVSLKNKLYNQNITIPITAQFIKKVQQSIDQEKQYRNIGQLFRRVFSCFSKFCIVCEEYSKTRSLPQAQLKATPVKQANSLNALLTKSKFYWNNSQSTFKKTINKLNHRFYTIGCLDIDYNFFKTSFFSVKNDSDEFYDSYLRRNDFSKQQIHLYSIQFRQYLKRKERARFLRKNRLNQGKNITRTHTLNITIKQNSQNDKNGINRDMLLQDQKKIPSCSQTNISLINGKRNPYKTQILLKQVHQQQKKKNFLKLKNVSIRLSQQKYQTFVQNSHKNTKQNQKAKTKYQIIKTTKLSKKGSTCTEPPQEFIINPNNHSFLDIRQYQYQKHIFKRNDIKIESTNQQSSSQIHRCQPIIFRNTKLRVNILQNKNVRIAQIPSPIKRNNISIKIISQ